MESLRVGKKEGIIAVYPARVKFRGFGAEQESSGYRKVSQYMKKNISKLVKEAFDE